MKFTKTLNVMAIAITACGFLLSCRNRKEEKPLPSELSLTAQVISLDSESSDLWGTNAEIGVFVTESGTSTICENNENIRYTTEFATGLLTLSPADEPIYLPDGGRIIDIFGYYPYKAELTSDQRAGYIYEVDLTDQYALDPSILLLARSEQRSSVLHTAMLTFKPVFAKLNVILNLNAETKSSGNDMMVAVNGIPRIADIDIMTGDYLLYGDEGMTVMRRPVQTIHSYEAVILAHETGENAEIVVSFPSDGNAEDIHVDLKELLNRFEQNTQYDVSITVTPDGIQATLVGISDYYVSDWKKDFDEINGETETK